MTTAPHAADVSLQCMEVWGGNTTFDGGVMMAGLDAWVYSVPHDGAPFGGDVYYVSSCATGRITRLLVADVSGHGSAVAELATVLRGLMRRCVNHLDLSHFVRAMNAEFARQAHAGRFATAFATAFFAPTGELTCCNAGHPVPLWYDASSASWSPLCGDACDDSDGPLDVPLGILDDGEYRPFVRQLGRGDLVLCFTDAMVEARRRNDGELLGADGFRTVVSGVDPTDAGTFIPRVLSALNAIADYGGDDVTLLLFRPNGMGQALGLRDRALAPLRMLRGMIRWRTPALPDLSVANIGGALFNRLSHVGRPGPNAAGRAGASADPPRT